MIYEWRAYYIMPGRMPDIQKRFADHTMRLFAMFVANQARES